MSIDPARYYSRCELNLGSRAAAFTEAILNGAITFTDGRDSHGLPGRVVLGGDVLRWIQAGSPTEAPAQAANYFPSTPNYSDWPNKRRPHSCSRVATTPQQSEGTKPMPTKDPVTEWNAAVNAKMKAGLNRTAATKAVVKENPELHTAYLKAANSNRPAASVHSL